MSVVDRSFEHPLKSEERASAPLAGGLLLNGYQCGMLWGAALAAGARAYQLYGSGPQAETGAMIATQKALVSFRARNKNEINCLEITDMNWQDATSALPVLKFFLKGGPIGCFSMSAGYASAAFNDIDTALSENHYESPAPLVSCAAVLAQKMDLSDLHIVMIAGLAGGIGLSGGACGALGAAIWINAMERDEKDKASQLDFQNPIVLEIIEKFLKCTDYEFECSKIVGRRFENINDHADYIHGGGCSKIIEALAAN